MTSANKLVSSTLAQNRDIVDRVARGEMADAFVTARFSSITGHKFYRDITRSALDRILFGEPILERVTYGVGVFIIHDKTRSQGFRIVTAYPRED